MTRMRSAITGHSICAASLVIISLALWHTLAPEMVHAKAESRTAGTSDRNTVSVYFPVLHYSNYRDYRSPSTPYPSDGATGVSINTFFRWNDDMRTLPDVSQDFHFEVYLAPGERPSALPIDRLSVNALDTATLAPDTVYTWQVISVDTMGRQYPGPEWTFQTLPVADTPSEIPDLGAMVYVPAGEFLMGCDSNYPNHPDYIVDQDCTGPTDFASAPLHTVYLDAFEIDKYETTNIEYKACFDAEACDLPRVPAEGDIEPFDNPIYLYHPVTYVSWENAQDYCAWQGKRLPTEAEWEKSARGSIDTRAWTWGHEPFTCDRINYGPDDKCPDGINRTAPVGQSPNGMSPYGSFDVAGNAAEWINDKFDWTYYGRSPYANPPGSNISRIYNPIETQIDEWGWPTYVIRGGDFWGRFRYHHTYYRYWGHWGEYPHADDVPRFRNRRTGFRCARSVEE
jgi:formylglycine-generating enzyme required for sulfatase activity